MAPVFRASVASLAILLLNAPASAEPIPITGGTLTSGTFTNEYRAQFSLSVRRMRRMRPLSSTTTELTDGTSLLAFGAVGSFR